MGTKDQYYITNHISNEEISDGYGTATARGRVCEENKQWEQFLAADPITLKLTSRILLIHS